MILPKLGSDEIPIRYTETPELPFTSTVSKKCGVLPAAYAVVFILNHAAVVQF